MPKGALYIGLRFGHRVFVMGQACYGPSMSSTEFVMGRDVPEPGNHDAVAVIEMQL